MKRYRRLLRIFMTISSITLLTIGLWWWRWQAPYRTLKTFLYALEKGDINTLYNLAPPKERELKIITPELIRYTCQNLLHPLLFAKYRLVSIERTSPEGMRSEIFIRNVAVRFYLYYRDDQGNEIKPPLVVYVTRPPGERRWYVPFSYYVFTTAHSLIGFDETQGDAWMYRAGYRFVYLHNGGIIRLKPPR
ncbi:hypothetical protein Q2T83_01470 [Fervidibacter sacchari]|uniref:Uncharacterized protein n=1 Tax=Candidatus Fervidibacter sacchari TaxID=1448929 RepID=A0ABT2ETA0_9BACT|nr:hypothetical protein [Candidatus Fervidibacter sacchari]MCS3921147.1 hypothetical protein [Candidatus Fervidibacter sacchari]WKU16506.1 hypothetical protein Q2T83_01470 [Candidatus Fervidibacter sacchari]